MSDSTVNVLAILAVICFICAQAVYFVYAAESLKGRTVKYDCSLAEISPDIPPRIKEDCRKLRAERGRF